MTFPDTRSIYINNNECIFVFLRLFFYHSLNYDSDCIKTLSLDGIATNAAYLMYY